jgi:hypothetical protein
MDFQKHNENASSMNISSGVHGIVGGGIGVSGVSKNSSNNTGHMSTEQAMSRFMGL